MRSADVVPDALGYLPRFERDPPGRIVDENAVSIPYPSRTKSRSFLSDKPTYRLQLPLKS